MEAKMYHNLAIVQLVYRLKSPYLSPFLCQDEENTFSCHCLMQWVKNINTKKVQKQGENKDQFQKATLVTVASTEVRDFTA